MDLEHKAPLAVLSIVMVIAVVGLLQLAFPTDSATGEIAIRAPKLMVPRGIQGQRLLLPTGVSPQTRPGVPPQARVRRIVRQTPPQPIMTGPESEVPGGIRIDELRSLAQKRQLQGERVRAIQQQRIIMTSPAPQGTTQGQRNRPLEGELKPNLVRVEGAGLIGPQYTQG